MEDLTPLYNKEFYLAYLCGEDVVLPIPDGNAERYLAYLCGMDVTIPDVPDGRTETYLAYKCGEDVVLPDPMYRIEYYLAKWCGIDCEVPEPLYRIEYWLAQLANSGELKTVTGNPISVSDALAKPAESLTIEILPQQDLNGYDNPWPAGGGKNLLPPLEDGTYEGNGVRAVVVNGVATFSGTTTSSGNAFIIPLSEEFTTPTTTAYIHMLNSEANGNVSPSFEDSADVGSTSVTFACNPANRIAQITKQGVKWNRVRFWIGSGITLSGTFSPMVCYDNTATAYAPYSNICPISGHTAVTVNHAGASQSDNPQSVTVQLGQTVYGGTLDVVSGVLTVDRAVVDLGDSNLSWKASSQINKFYCTDAPDYKPGADTEMMCSIYKFDGAVKVAPYYGENGTIRCWARSPGAENKELYVHDDRFSDLASFVSAMSGVQLVYELATPLSIQLTPTEIEMLLGENVIWNDVGDMVLEYLADGPADDIDALQILLNNRYVNNGEPDEATDREALEILLGGNTR